MSITEQKMWRSLKPKLSKHGMPCRVENVASTSIPDLMLFTEHNTVIPIELKIWASKTAVYFNRYQIAWWTQYLKQTNSDGLIVVSEKNDFKFTAFLASGITPENITPMAGNRVKLTLTSLIPMWFTTDEEIERVIKWFTPS